MRLRILTPTEVLDNREADRIAAEGMHGAFTLLPRHVDIVVPLLPGILTATTDDGEEVFYGTDQGVLVKKGSEVTVSVMKGVRSERLEELRRVMGDQFDQLDEREQRARSSIHRLESQIARKFFEIEKNAG